MDIAQFDWGILHYLTIKNLRSISFRWAPPLYMWDTGSRTGKMSIIWQGFFLEAELIRTQYCINRDAVKFSWHIEGSARRKSEKNAKKLFSQIFSLIFQEMFSQFRKTLQLQAFIAQPIRPSGIFCLSPFKRQNLFKTPITLVKAIILAYLMAVQSSGIFKSLFFS